MFTSRVARSRIADLRTFTLTFSLLGAGCLGEEVPPDEFDAQVDAQMDVDVDASVTPSEPDASVDCPCAEDASSDPVPCALPDAAVAPIDAETLDAGHTEEDAGAPEDAATVDATIDVDADVSPVDAGGPSPDASNNMPWATVTYAPINGAPALSLRAFNLATRITPTGELASEWIVMVRNDSDALACNPYISASYYDADGFERLRTSATLDAAPFRESAPSSFPFGSYYTDISCIAPGATVPGWGPVTLPPGLALEDLENIYVSISAGPPPGLWPIAPLVGHAVGEVTTSTRAGNPYFRADVAPVEPGATLTGAVLYPVNAGGMPLDRVVSNGFAYDYETGVTYFEVMGNRKYSPAGFVGVAKYTVPPPPSTYPY